jgi:acetate CoA/acetoacetate CoA-transferase beta subunit
METADGITIEQVLAATEAELAISRELVGTSGARTNSESVSASSMGEPA